MVLGTSESVTEIHEPSLLFVVLPASDPALLDKTLRTIRTQDYQQWRCVVLHDSYLAEAERVVSSAMGDDSRVSMAPAEDSIPASINRILESADEEYLSLLLPPVLLMPDYCRSLLLDGPAAVGETLDVQSAEAIAPEDIPPLTPEGSLVLAKYLESPPLMDATVMRTAAVMSAGGFSAAYPRAFQFELGLRLLAGGSRWNHSHAYPVVRVMNAARVTPALESTMEASREVSRMLAGAVIDLPARDNGVVRVIETIISPGAQERIRVKRALWSRLMSSESASSAVRLVAAHRAYFSYRSWVLAVILTRMGLGRLIAGRALRQLEQL